MFIFKFNSRCFIMLLSGEKIVVKYFETYFAFSECTRQSKVKASYCFEICMGIFVT